MLVGGFIANLTGFLRFFPSISPLGLVGPAAGCSGLGLRSRKIARWGFEAMAAVAMVRWVMDPAKKDGHVPSFFVRLPEGTGYIYIYNYY